MELMSDEVQALKATCQSLIHQAGELKAMILDHRQSLWCTVPSFDPVDNLNTLELQEPSTEAWYRLVSELTDVWMDSSSGAKHHHGTLLCPNVDILNALSNFNETKAQLRQITDDLKSLLFEQHLAEENPSVTPTYVQNFALARAEYLNKSRDQAFHHILKSLRLPELNFTRARKQVRILPDSTLRLTYTWNKNHYRKRQIPRATLKTLSGYFDSIGKEDRADEILDGLENHHYTKLYRLTTSRPTLRANYKYIDDNDLPCWSNCLASGILVLPQANRPQIRWKAAPTESEIKQAQSQWLRKSRLVPVKIATNLELYHHAG